MHFFNRTSFRTLFKTLMSSLVSLLLLTAVPASAENGLEPLDKYQWTYDTDPYGSEAIINEKLIRHSGIWIKFKRAPRINDTRNTWVELIHKIPAATLAGISKIRLTYQCEIPLIVRLSQQNYGKNVDKGGNNISPKFQFELPATKQWVTKEIDLSEFSLPVAKHSNIDIANTELTSVLAPEEIDAIYLIPSFTDKDGGEAIIQVRSIELLPSEKLP
ncbi:hypothetical protein [Colwellia echini]|uniref:Uncharacterized protein n=1 Tax=Colwellia echini TaxID=1982103 RepID=A0ABY3MWX1_9GAMM|nr:hypothetical protein [Colwellia echini]TYK65708.1 hypothetical protein CWS31_008610 [Colwellia echini]